MLSIIISGAPSQTRDSMLLRQMLLLRFQSTSVTCLDVILFHLQATQHIFSHYRAEYFRRFIELITLSAVLRCDRAGYASVSDTGRQSISVSYGWLQPPHFTQPPHFGDEI